MRIADLDEHTVHVPIAVPESSRDGAVPSVLPVLTPARAVLSALGDLWFEDAVGALDALLRVGRPGFDERLEPYATRRSLEDFTDQLARAHGIVRFREALEWARVGADSIMESLCRMHFTRAEIDEPEINVPVPLGNGQVMRPPDGWWPQYRTVFEYQGAGHQSLQQMRRDDRIHSEFESHGIRVVRLFNEDLVRSPMRPPPPMRETTRRPDTWHSLPPGDVLSAQNPAVLRVSAALKLGGWKGSSSRPLR